MTVSRARLGDREAVRAARSSCEGDEWIVSFRHCLVRKLAHKATASRRGNAPSAARFESYRVDTRIIRH